MSDKLGWPGELGVPLNPERDGLHILKHQSGSYQIREWSCEHQAWVRGLLGRITVREIAELQWSYVGCCVTLAEIEQREREAELRGWEQAIEFFEELDVPSDHREYAATLKALRVELSRRRAETGA